MAMFFLLIAVTLVAGLVVAYLLNKWFRADMEKCRADITAGATGADGRAAGAGPPPAKLAAKLYGAVAVFAVVVMFVGGAGLYQLNRELKIRDEKLKSMESWTARFRLKLSSGRGLVPQNLRVAVRPPDIGFAPEDSESKVVLVSAGRLPTQRPARDNLPKLYVSYPGYWEREVPLSRDVIAPGSVYVDSLKTVTVGGVVTLARAYAQDESTPFRPPEEDTMDQGGGAQ